MGDKAPKKRKYTEAKREADKARSKTRVNLGIAFPRWRALKERMGLKSDAVLGCLLLDCYERAPVASTSMKGKLQAAAVSHIGGTNRNDKADEDEKTDNSSDEEYYPPVCIGSSGELEKSPSIYRPVTGVQKTEPDPPAQEEKPVFPAPQQVLSEKDIIAARASIAYEDCLRQLATFLMLPVRKCTGVFKNGVACGCVAPFEVKITSKGTATSVEWVCPLGHSLWKWNSQPVMKSGMQAGDFLLSASILLSGNSYTKVALLLKFMNMGMVDKNTFLSIQDSYCIKTIKDFWEERSGPVTRLQAKDVIQECPADILQVTVSNEEVPLEQQEWSSGLEKEVPEPQHIKQEHEEQCVSQKGEQLQVKMLKALVKQRITMDTVFNPKVQLDRAVSPADVQQQSVVLPEQLEWDHGAEKQVPEPSHIKEEQEELWISQQGEELQGQDDAGIVNFPITSVHVKSEDHEDEPQSSQLHQKQTEEGDRKDCGGSEPAGSLDPDRHLQTDTDDRNKDSDEDQTKSREPAPEQMEIEADGDDCEGSQPDMNLVRVYTRLFLDSQYGN